MKVCASLGSVDDIRSDELPSADMIEIRADVFDAIPKNILRKGQTGLVSFKNGITMSVVPDDWIIDIEDACRPDLANKIMTSYHNFDGTPDLDEIIKMIGSMDGDIVKTAFKVNSVKDAVTLLNASVSVRKKHVILGMGDIGTVTRIRQRMMKNEFTFAHAGKPTAPGQLSVREMKRLGDDCIITGIAGSDIGYTRSPAMHDAAFEHSGINGKYLPFDTPSLDGIDEFIIGYDIKGINVTKPYKTDILEYVKCDKMSEAVGAVNTVVNDRGKLKGYNTDVHGIEEALKAVLPDTAEKALIVGSGGAARSCAYFLSENGSCVTITGRNKDAVRKIASEFSLRPQEKEYVDIKEYDLIVNCTPLNMDGTSEYPVKIEQINSRQTIFDMVYGRTRLTDTAESKRCRIVRGEDMLAYQGIKAFELFTSVRVPYEVMRAAI
ncbi:MAG: type I 3-dehydroquinate dehydratase [Methanomassiliicoccaceae archaeon]|nr:type I 3-dehydroquinate dehydratase [Methanomassiliicoccaceae archaeon]